MRWLSVFGIVFILNIQLSFATGASTIHSNIVPLAINQDGDILCKSFYSENEQGSRSLRDVDVSLCLVKDGAVHALQIIDQFIPQDDYHRDHAEYDKLRERFRSMTFASNEPLISGQYDDLIAQGFQAIQLDQYAISPHFSANSFYQKWGVHYQDLKQIVLNGDSTPEVFEAFDPEALLTTVQLQYQIGNQIWLLFDECPKEVELQNRCSEDAPLDDEIRAIYYLFPLYYEYKDRDTNIYGKNPEPFGFDYQNVNAIIILPES